MITVMRYQAWRHERRKMCSFILEKGRRLARFAFAQPENGSVERGAALIAA